MFDDHPRDWVARHTVGNLLDDLGVVYLHLGALDRAGDCFRATLARDPGNANARENLDLLAGAPRDEGAAATEIERPVLGCTDCASILPHEDAVPCAGCGMPRESPAPCGYCGTADVATGPRCPICRTGTLTMRDAVEL
jgi:hypothetical protein